MRAIQPYTTDRQLVRQAVARVIPSQTSSEERTIERTDELVAQRRALRGEGGGLTGASAAAGGGGAALARAASEIGEREHELHLVETELNMLRSFRQFDRDCKGYDSRTGLLAVVRSLSNYPGRKTVVFFSDGLPVSPVLSARLDMLIDAANRANVTIYAVDTNGLRAKSTANDVAQGARRLFG